jgi:hypothetical protein
VENRDSGAQKRAALRRWLTDRTAMLSRQGYIVETWREYRGRRLGPYYRLRYRAEGRGRSIYLGRDAAFAEEVRDRLRDLQSPLRKKREAHKRWKQERAQLRKLKARWEVELRKIGLRLKGFEVRGPVTAALRRAFWMELQARPAAATGGGVGWDKAASAAEGPPARAARWAGARCASLSHPTSGRAAAATSGQDRAICGKTAIECPKEKRVRRWRASRRALSSPMPTAAGPASGQGVPERRLTEMDKGHDAAHPRHPRPPPRLQRWQNHAAAGRKETEVVGARALLPLRGRRTITSSQSPHTVAGDGCSRCCSALSVSFFTRIAS